MAGYADICCPYIRTFFVARIPYQIILIICNAPHCKVYIIDPVIFSLVFQFYLISTFFLACIFCRYNNLLIRYFLCCYSYTRLNSVFPGHIGMNIILRIFDIRRHFNRHFIRTITLLFRLMPYKIALVWFAPYRNQDFLDTWFTGNAFDSYFKTFLFHIICTHFQGCLRFWNFKCCLIQKDLLSIYNSIYMNQIFSGCFMILDRSLCTPCIWRRFFSFIPYQIILIVSFTPHCKINACCFCCFLIF